MKPYSLSWSSRARSTIDTAVERSRPAMTGALREAPYVYHPKTERDRRLTRPAERAGRPLGLRAYRRQPSELIQDAQTVGI